MTTFSPTAALRGSIDTISFGNDAIAKTLVPNRKIDKRNENKNIRILF